MANILPILEDERTYSLRVSVLENCQFSCPYCLPGTLKPFASKPSWLTIPQYLAVAESLGTLPISKVRFTGGEPLLRPNIFEIIRAFSEKIPNAALSVTTNGEHLPKKLPGLLKAGISGLNVHIDSLKPEKYKQIMGNGDIESLLHFLPEIKSSLSELKINVVLQKGVNDDELTDFIAFSLQSGIEIRFIELMNTGSAKAYVYKTFLSGAAAIDILRKRFDIKAIGRRKASDPASLYEIPSYNLKFGLIASDTQPFCENCNRLRLNAQGELRGCLYQPNGVALGSMLRKEASTHDLKEAIQTAVAGKRSFHPTASASKYEFSMAEIGG